MKDEYLKRSSEIVEFKCPECDVPLDIDKLLCVYGPEGLYDLAALLIKAADDDVSDSYYEK